MAGPTGDTPDVIRVSVLTPTIEGRESLLADAADSVQAQTEPCVHLVWLDADREGPAVSRNRLLALAQTEYVAFLDDDDLLDPTHVEALVALLANGQGAAVAWSRCRTRHAPDAQPVRIPYPIRPDYRQLCRGGRNWIPVTVVARTDAIRELGGFDPEARYEDYDLWCRMIAAGHTFAYLRDETWTYRFLGGNRTWGGGG